MATVTCPSTNRRKLLESPLAYHLRCLREDPTDLEMKSWERLALVRDRAARIREIRQELEAAKVTDRDRVHSILG